MTNFTVAIEKHITVSVAGQTVISALSESCPEISKQKLKQAMQFGALWLTRNNKTTRLRRAKKELDIGDELHLYYDEKILFGDLLQARLVADEREYSVWNKPCGMFSQGTKWGDHSAICRWVELIGLELNGLAQRPTFLVHRLDRATSGLIVVAHTKKMAAKLSSLFESRQIEKRYLATVVGEFTGVAENQRIEEKIDGRNASTQLLKFEYDPTKKQSHLLLKLETGRKHQIRKHLSTLGYPIVGDRLYGNYSDEQLTSEQLPNLQLQSSFLGFISPVSGKYQSYQLAR